MDKSGSGGIQQQLKTGGSTAAVLATGGNAVFQFNDLMDRAPSGPLALYLTALFLTLSFTITQNGGTGVAIPRDRYPGLFIDSIDWTQTWMGSAAPKSVFVGSRLPLIEFVGGGFQYGQRQENQILAANGAYVKSFTVRVPALNDRRGRCVKETSNLALLYQPSQLKVTLATLGTIQAFSPGATMSNVTTTLTAQLEPRQELVLGTPMEWVLHTPVSGGPQVTIQGFGRDTAMSGVKPKGGVSFCADLSLVNGQGGVVTPNVFVDFQWQWRGQPVTTDIKGWVQQFLDLLPNDRPQISSATNAGTADRVNDAIGFPYSINNGQSSSGTCPDLDFLLLFPLVMGGDDMELTDIQTAESDQTFNANQTGGFGAGNHLILTQYARVWEDAKIADWLSQVTRGGASSLASYVLGGPQEVAKALAYGRNFPGGLPRRRPNLKHVVTGDQDTYLSRQLVAPAA